MKKILPFLLITFAISWSVALLIYLTGTEYGNMSSQILVAMYFMWGPATAAIIFYLYRWNKPFREIGFAYQSRTNDWLYLTPMIFTGMFILYMGVLFLFGNIFGIESFGRLDFSDDFLLSKMGDLNTQSEFGAKEPVALPFPAWVMFLISFGSGLTAGAGINIVFTFGEELGWRGFLLRHTQHLGFWKTNLLTGTIWGFWHAPLIAMGHNYPGHPVSGIFMMIASCILLGVIFNYVMHKSGSILIPTVLHAIFNGTVGAAILVTDGGSTLFTHFLGVSGIIVMLITITVILLIDRKYISSFSEQNKDLLTASTES